MTGEIIEQFDTTFKEVKRIMVHVINCPEVPEHLKNETAKIHTLVVDCQRMLEFNEVFNENSET